MSASRYGPLRVIIDEAADPAKETRPTKITHDTNTMRLTPPAPTLGPRNRHERRKRAKLRRSK